MLDRTIAPPAGKINESFDIQTAHTSTLDNGTRLHTLFSGNQEAVRLELIFNGGNWNQNTAGASYFATKLLSSGTPNFTSKQIENALASAGAFLELEGSNEKNTVTLYVLAKHLELLLPLIFEIITRPTYPQEELDNLKKITQQNLSINQNKTSYVASTNFREALYGKTHPYGRAMSESVINGVDRDSLLGFFNQTFSNDNCDIVLSGNGSLDFEDIINNYFGKSPWGKSQNTYAKHTFEYVPLKHTIEKEGSLQSSIRMGFPLFNITHPDYLETSVLIEIFGGYFGSRLMKNIREDKGYTYGISSNLVSMLHSGYVVIGTDVGAEHTEDTFKEIYKEIDLLRNHLVGEEELTLVKNYLTGSFLNSLNTPFALADRFKSIYFNNLSSDFYKRYLTTIENVTAERLQNLAQKYLLLNQFTELVVGKR